MTSAFATAPERSRAMVNTVASAVTVAHSQTFLRSRRHEVSSIWTASGLWRTASRCCRAAGWWSGPSPGWDDARRLSKDYEATTSGSEAFIKLAMIHLMARRLTKKLRRQLSLQALTVPSIVTVHITHSIPR